jgi:prepilin-type processing-associated H-X9-DG protein
VLVIVALLTVMLFPAIGRVRTSAQRVSCQSNLRQIGMGCDAYSRDWGGRHPPVDYYASPHVSILPYLYGDAKAQLVGPQANVKKYRAFICPAGNFLRGTSGVANNERWIDLGCDYGVNEGDEAPDPDYFGRDSMPGSTPADIVRKWNLIPSTFGLRLSRLAMMADRTGDLIADRHPLLQPRLNYGGTPQRFSVAYVSRAITTVEDIAAATGRPTSDYFCRRALRTNHGGRQANVLFWDLHVASTTPEASWGCALVTFATNPPAGSGQRDNMWYGALP